MMQDDAMGEAGAAHDEAESAPIRRMARPLELVLSEDVSSIHS